jgi:protein-S-isoprenylcysteine O-methyltransferase Ste14
MGVVTTAAELEAGPPPRGGEQSLLAEWGRAAASGVLAILWLFFAWAMFVAWDRSGKPSGIGAVALELVLVVLFIVRRAPRGVSRNPFDWAITVAAFAVLVARPETGGPSSSAWAFEGMQIVGVAGAVWSLVALGRSFGLVAAHRGIQTKGPYGVVRHPVYAFYFVVWTGYLLESPTVRNIVVFSFASVCQFLRIRREEAFLGSDPEYRAYRDAVRYRLVPHVY